MGTKEVRHDSTRDGTSRPLRMDGPSLYLDPHRPPSEDMQRSAHIPLSATFAPVRPTTRANPVEPRADSCERQRCPRGWARRSGCWRTTATRRAARWRNWCPRAGRPSGDRRGRRPAYATTFGRTRRGESWSLTGLLGEPFPARTISHSIRGRTTAPSILATRAGRTPSHRGDTAPATTRPRRVAAG